MKTSIAVIFSWEYSLEIIVRRRYAFHSSQQTILTRRRRRRCRRRYRAGPFQAAVARWPTLRRRRRFSPSALSALRGRWREPDRWRRGHRCGGRPRSGRFINCQYTVIISKKWNLIQYIIHHFFGEACFFLTWMRREWAYKCFIM